ncbi:uncharacterized protein A1O5_12774 [Cladophialophora psammophila CBS 110553]|uniref:Inhibitor of growth protein N-terminal histone-binding domain-containing protein n=1 Tax=Cladophialophora psammophila CBS 110553 TaxID=1182543 RepID=W9VPV1_9EURO|nr:uncharacterized protein A1O5_12774 [Cladophialophora psammophila CBS 110553]EXJ55035.1 hypothetical protein A1O5_12774 [Cladophialophora psammophila CBS 110553]
MAEIASNRAVDPDAQAAVTDFLDYTEYLPSDLIRSLTLIRGLDDAYLNNSLVLHDLAKLYGSLPSLEAASRPNAQGLRAQISTSLDRALNARESAYAEACRLFDVIDRHQNRLKSIIAKLNAIPKPPSRDPTPQPTPSTQVKRSRSGRKIETGTSTRLTLHPPRGNTVASAILKRPRGRRVTVPGDVMPPYDPDSPIASTEVSDWESPPPSPPRPVLKLKQPKPPAPAKHSKQRPPPVDEKTRESREATEPYHKPSPPPEDAEIGSKWRPWTHLTEYEMYKLRKKMKKNHAWEPSDVMIRRELADRGRGWDNYYRAKAEAQANGTRFIDIDSIEKLTPKTERPEKPETLDQIESVEKPDTSEVVGKVEEADIPTQEPEILEKSEESATAAGGTPAPKPKPSKKNEKKEKKPDPARSQAALAAQEAELAARRLGDIGSKFRTLFTTPFTSALASLSRSASTPIASRPTATGKKGIEKTSKKRKAEDTPISSVSPSAEPETARKKQKIAPKPSPLAASPIPAATPTSPAATSSEPPPSTSMGTIKIPLKLNVAAAATATAPGVVSASASKTPTPAPATRAPSVQRNSVAPKPESTPPASTTTSSRPPSRRSAAASVEPQFPTTRSSRRPSTTPSLAGGQKTPAEKETQGPSPKAVTAIPTAASRRSKRDAPGMVTQSSQDGGAAVSVSKRKTKPAKKTSSTAQVPQIRIDVDGRQEIVDPDEERYCLCGDVSWGEMICCELDEKCDYGQWFHMECVSLVELPPRTVKWYCPGDRKKHHKGETTNGLVGRGIK